jgi:multicomponent Na+:H+ antiporter subunit F
VTPLILGSILAVIALAAVYFGTLVLRRSFFDRLLALNGLGTKAAILVVLIGLLYGRLDMFVDIALSLFLLNFVTTLLIAKYMRARGSSS